LTLSFTGQHVSFSAFKISDLFIGFTRQFLSEQVPNQRPMPWRKNMTVGDRTTVADRIGGGTFCKKICKTAKGGSVPMTASRNLKYASAVINFLGP